MVPTGMASHRLIFRLCMNGNKTGISEKRRIPCFSILTSSAQAQELSIPSQQKKYCHIKKLLAIKSLKAKIFTFINFMINTN
jgi:hypothetical protein